jgi:uroporphyrinogen-III synthase
MRILITRPRTDASLLADKLTALGHDVLIEPMLEIRFTEGATVDLAGVQAVLFTSANGVRAFAVAEKRRDLPTFTVGDATAETARRSGFTQVESAGGDVADLVRLVRECLQPARGALLHAAASAVAGDLGGQLGASGFEVRRAVLYAAEPIQALSPAAVAALSEEGMDLVVFFSGRTAETFARVVEKAGLAPKLSRTVALGLSPAAVEPVRRLPWAKVEAARHPEEADILQAIPRQVIVSRINGQPIPSDPDPEIKFGRRGNDAARSAAPGGKFSRTLLWLAVLLSLGTFGLQSLQSSRPLPDFAPATTLRLETRLQALESQIAALRAAPVPPAAPADDAQGQALKSQIDALAGRVETLSRAPAPAPAEEALNAAAARLDAVEKALAARPDVGQLAALLAENRRMAADLARLQEQVAALTATTSEHSTSHDGLLLAMGQLSAAATRGAPVTAELATLRAVAGDDPHLGELAGRLQPFADRPVPSFEDLVARFSTAAAQAGTTPLSPHGMFGESAVAQWWDGVVHRLSSAVTVRRVGDVSGDGLDARVARAEQRLQARDLAGAVTAFDGMSVPLPEAVAAWIEAAKARLALDRGIAELTQAVIAAAGVAR